MIKKKSKIYYKIMGKKEKKIKESKAQKYNRFSDYESLKPKNRIRRLEILDTIFVPCLRYSHG